VSAGSLTYSFNSFAGGERKQLLLSTNDKVSGAENSARISSYRDGVAGSKYKIPTADCPELYPKVPRRAFDRVGVAMELVVVILIIALYVAYKLVKAGKGGVWLAAKPGTLCATCVNVYRVKGAKGKELIYCNYTSDLRAIDFEVCECSGYRSSHIVPLTRVIGFAPGEASDYEEAFPAVAIQIERE
jgi:hypothetical protein